MKKITTILMALMVLCFTQCKKPIDELTGRKVKVSCTIPINKGGRSDLTNLMEDGSIKWSTGTERIYLALPNETNPQIIELTAFSTLQSSELAFEGEVDENLLEEGDEYEVWYLGNSKNLDVPYITENKVGEDEIITSVSGSIAEQSGSKDDLGYHHIAKASVYINVDNGITLTFKGDFENQIAIAHLDLTNVAGLSGEAIVGTDYSLEYIDGAYRFNVTSDNNSINITGNENKNKSYVVLFPTDKNAKDVELNSDSNKKMVFHNGIKRNTLYKENDNKPLIWELPEHECVDLGLPSGVKWATCNIGADAPEGYGNYYAWGEIEEPSPAEGYVQATCGTYNKRMNDISGHETYDAATAKWGEGWRIPTKAECEELMNANYCTWSWIEQNDVNGYLVTSEINGNYIFLPAAGNKSGSTDEIINGGVYGTYSCSTPAERGNDDDAEKSYTLGFNDKTKAIGRIYRENGRVVRPVTGGDFENPAAQYAEVTTAEVSGITISTAVCGGEVIANSEITFRGIYWGTSADYIYTPKMYPATDGADEYTVELTGLKPNTTYYVKAYATFNNNEYYGEVKSFTTLDYEYVDLGLPSGTLWATQNVGATTPQEKGNSYKWGATEVGGASYNGFEDISGTQYDAATANWNSGWRMPTREQMIELHEKCTWEYEGTGYRVIGPNMNEIFLPNTELVHIIEGYYSCYWTSQPIPPGSVALRFNNGIHEPIVLDKDNACAIRPVRSK